MLSEKECEAVEPPALPLQVSEEFSSIALIGDLTEEVANEVIFSFLLLNEKQTIKYLNTLALYGGQEVKEADLEKLRPSIEFYISTNGGSADEMFGIYDIMRMVKDDSICSIETCGIGKVMSAGVLLLAAGTKGKRRVGKSCRIMLHSVIGGHTGPMHHLENEFEEVRRIQNTYIQALCDETDMTEEYFRDLLGKKQNVYLSAEEAVELGIADEVF